MNDEILSEQLYSGSDNSGRIKELEREIERQIGFKNDYRAAFEETCDQKEKLEEYISTLIDATDYLKNRLEYIASASWHGDGRDLKRSIAGIFLEYDEAIKAKGSTNE